MSEPITWTYLKAVEDCLKEIKVANGFHTDLGLHTTREPAQIPETAAGLLLVMLDGVLPATDPALRGRHVGGKDATVSIVPKLPADIDDGQRLMHLMLEDVDRAMDFSGERQKRFPLSSRAPVFDGAEPVADVDQETRSMTWQGWAIRYRFSYAPRR